MPGGPSLASIGVRPQRSAGRLEDSSMVDATAEFFERLGSRGHEPLLEKMRGTVRVDLESGDRTEHWLVTVDDGDVKVSHRNAKADCTVRTRKDVFDDL